MLIDTHCHLTADPYDDDRSAVLERARDLGVGAVISIASDLDDAEQAIDLADRATTAARGGRGIPLWATAGVHPHEVGALERTGVQPDVFRERLLGLQGRERVVAVGECGLDFHYDFSPRDVQRRWFELQLEIAGEIDRPVVVHCRDAETEMADRVREAGRRGVRGVLHCFPGDPDLLDAALDSGWSVSFTGMITFGSFDGTEAVRRVPADRYFVETDGPYLAPIPHRGTRNEPAHVTFVAERVAELRGESLERVCTESSRNAVKFFGLTELDRSA